MLSLSSIDSIRINSPFQQTNMADTKIYLSVFDVRVRSLNPWTLPSSVLPVMLGTLLAWKSSQKFDPFYLVLCSLVIIGTHAAGNFVNSYYEARTRRFYSSASERYLTIHESARCAVVSYCLVIPTFAFLLVFSGSNLWQELTLFVIGFLTSVLFGNCLKNLALGEFAVSAIYGPLCVMFTYAVQAGPSKELSWLLLALYSLPLSLNTECLLHR
jgi:1,4-dihydroxy-2-naphthoate octaprenyltransferase